MDSREPETDPTRDRRITRRSFLTTSTNMALGGTLANTIWVGNGLAAVPVPPSQGYLLVDSKKCQGCTSCMLACSLVHDGVESLSRSRIQVLQNSFENWPGDLSIEQCRQCVDPACVRACPSGALRADPEHGNVRMVDPRKCTRCLMCVDHCPYKPSRPTVVPDGDRRVSVRVVKCDLCADARYHWDERGGGPSGKQACVEVCPVGAIKFTREIPLQEHAGYDVNLRGPSWSFLGYPTD